MSRLCRKIAVLASVCTLITACMTGCGDTNTGTGSENSSEVTNASVTFSKSSGIYEEAFSLEIKAVEEGEIYYTTDGSDPTISATAVVYSEPIQVADRKGDPNVVSAVDPVLFSGNYNKVNSSRNGFTCTISAPADEDVDKCTVIRAAVKKADGSFGAEAFATYFIGAAEEHIQGLKESCEAGGTSLAVMSINMNYEDLFDSQTGIYVKGDIFETALAEYLQNNRLKDAETARSLDANYKQKGKEWEREAAITLFEVSADGTASAVLSQNCGIRIQGNYSRSDLQKGFRLYARTEYGENNFDYTVFGEDYVNVAGEVMDKFDTLVLRNGGNCAFTSKFNDTYWQSLVEELSCSTKQSRPCVVYLNGEYWGLYILEEDYTNDYIEDYYGVSKDDVVIYKGDAEALELGYKLDEGDIPEGEHESYYFKELLEFFENHDDLEAEEDYNEFIKLVDPDSVMDYFAVNCWIDNKWDWPGKNWSMWKTTTTDDSSEYGDGRWRLMFYDIEFGGVCGEGDAYNNTIKNANYKTNGLLDMNTDNPAVLCFAYLMTNDNFKTEFCEKLAGLSESCFEKETALSRLQEFEDSYLPLFEQFFNRYPGTGSAEEAVNGGYATPKCIRDFLENRANNIQKQISFCDKILGE